MNEDDSGVKVGDSGFLVEDSPGYQVRRSSHGLLMYARAYLVFAAPYVGSLKRPSLMHLSATSVQLMKMAFANWGDAA